MRKPALSGNILKWIAAVSMLIDHMGVILFPQWRILRILGRISFPIFAFMIAEGSRYTKNKLRYFLTLCGMGIACQLVLFAYNGSLELNILLTFSLSLLLIFAFGWLKDMMFAETTSFFHPFAAVLLFAGMLAGVVLLGMVADLDYGVTGCLVPLFAALLHPPTGRKNTALHRIDRPLVHVLTMGVGLLLLSVDDGGLQWFCLFALPLLFFYSGERGRASMKYFFYIFYPVHLLLLQGLACFL